MTQREKLLKEWEDLHAIWIHYRDLQYVGGFTKRQKNNNRRKHFSMYLRLRKIKTLILSLPIEETPTPK